MSSFFKKASLLFSGLFIVQVINLLFSLALVKIYSPEDFAVFGIFLSTIFIFFEIVNFKLDQALMIPQDEDESIFIYKKALKISLGIGLILALIFLIYYLSPLFQIYYRPLLWIPLSVFLQGIIQPTLSYCNRIQSYSLINLNRILQALTIGTVSCLPFFIGQEKILLVEGFVSGQVISILALSIVIIKLLSHKNETKNLSIKNYIQFPKYGTWSSLLNTISRNSIVYILNYFFTPYWVGLFTFTNRLAQAPIGLITSSIGQVYFRDASHANDNNEIRILTQKIQKYLSRIAILPVFIAIIWGPELFQFFFGIEWRQAGEIARYLAIWYGTSLIVTPLSMLLDVKGYLLWELKYNFLFAIARIGILCICGYWGNFKLTMIAFCIVSVLFHLYLLKFVNRIARHEN